MKTFLATLFLVSVFIEVHAYTHTPMKRPGETDIRSGRLLTYYPVACRKKSQEDSWHKRWLTDWVREHQREDSAEAIRL
ncbi:MAG: hypothetical protein ACPGJV_06510 [Bacteriovoracaceae bacterium]